MKNLKYFENINEGKDTPNDKLKKYTIFSMEKTIYYHGTGEANKVKDALLNGSFIFHKSAGVENGIYLTPNKELASQYADITNGNDKGVLEIPFKHKPNFKFYKNAGEHYDDERSFSHNPKEATLKYREYLLLNGYDGVTTGNDVFTLFKEKINLIDVNKISISIKKFKTF